MNRALWHPLHSNIFATIENGNTLNIWDINKIKPFCNPEDQSIERSEVTPLLSITQEKKVCHSNVV
jgi:hypothetical protein